MSEELSALIPQTDREKLQNVLKDLESYKEITITNDVEFKNAGSAIATLKKTKNDLDLDRKEKVDPLNAKVNYINGQYNPIIKVSIQNAINKLDVAMGNYQRKLMIEREAEQKKRDAEAAETRRKLEEAARKEAEKIQKYEEEGRTELAQKAEARFEKHIEQAETTVAAKVEEVKVAGTGFRTYYTAEYIQPMDSSKIKAIQACLKNPILVPHVHIDLKALAQLQKKVEGTLHVDGIKFEKKYGTITRTK
jgi:hypothetical protein